jgi:hypothetical protein
MTVTKTRPIEQLLKDDGAFEYLDPRRGPGVSPDPYLPRLSRTAVGQIGLFTNQFVDATNLLEDLRAPVGALLPAASFKHYDKGSRLGASFPAPQERIDQIVSECSSAILAYGHCGSCTAGTVRDGVALARAGVPVAVLVTTKFRELADFMARAGGLPDLPFVFLPHPIAGRDKEFHQRIAAGISSSILSALHDGVTSDCSSLS